MKSMLKMGSVVDWVSGEVVCVEVIMSCLSISLYKSFLFLGFHDREEVLFHCLIYPIFIANSNNFGLVSLLTIVSDIDDSSIVNIKPPGEYDKIDEEDQSLIVQYLCI